MSRYIIRMTSVLLMSLFAGIIVSNVAMIYTNGHQVEKEDLFKALPDTIEHCEVVSPYTKIQLPRQRNPAIKVVSPQTKIQLLQRRRNRNQSPASNHNSTQIQRSKPTTIPKIVRDWHITPEEDPDVFGTGTGLWNWSPPAAHHKSVVRIYVAITKGRKTKWYMGSGVIVRRTATHYEILTCYHVVEGAEKYVTAFSDKGVAVEGRVLKSLSTEESDTALISVPIPKNSVLQPVKIADDSPKSGDRLECLGYGGSSKLLRTFYSVSGPMTNRQRTIVYQSFAPGDSGGPVFNDDKELVGLMSRAAIDWWYPDPPIVYRDREVKLAWPGLLVGLRPINGAMGVN
jgi:S1-C subfamily serine protease